MNSINNVENVLDEYYNVLCERNDSNRVVITPEYIDSLFQTLFLPKSFFKSLYAL